jgi:hypothetical protein
VIYWHTVWFHYVYGSLLGNGPEAIAQTIIYAAIAMMVYPPIRRGIERRWHSLHEKLDAHHAAGVEDRQDLLRHMRHIIEFHPDIPPLPPKET